MSEYMIANERATAQVINRPPTATSDRADSRNNQRGHHKDHKKDRHRNGSRAPSAASVHRSQHYDNDGSDIYVTSAAYRAPSEVRSVHKFI